MRVRYTLRARSDLDNIYTYLEQRAPDAAQSVKDLIERRIAALADFPFMAPETIARLVGQLSPDPLDQRALFN